MKIVVVCVEDMSSRPPVIQLLKSLLELGHSVKLVGRGLGCLPEEVKSSERLSIFDLGEKGTSWVRVLHSLSDRKSIQKVLREEPDVDLVWAATDMSIRECSGSLLEHKFVAQLPELVEFVPFLRIGSIYLRDLKVPEIVRRASCVVVPEYNRAHIQKVWWGLPELPTVLPNKSVLPADRAPSSPEHAVLSELFCREEKKILLYQGGFTSDRDLTPIVDSLKLLDKEYALYIMGPINSDEERRRVDSWCSMSPDVHYVGFVNPPDHLLFTGYGHIGLLPYTPSLDKTRASSLNALYCAPNKVWEYSRAGLPMLGSDVPGLNSTFSRYGLGITTNLDNPKDIATAIRDIEVKYDFYSRKNLAFYQNVNVREIIATILDKCLQAVEQ